MRVHLHIRMLLKDSFGKGFWTFKMKKPNSQCFLVKESFLDVPQRCRDVLVFDPATCAALCPRAGSPRWPLFHAG